MLKKEFEFLVDSREGHRIFYQTKLLGIEYTKYALPSGDFAVRERESKKMLAGFERKTVNDLINSVQQRRIFDQARRMTSQYPIAFLVIVGDISDALLQFEKMHLNINLNVIWGALSSLIVRNGLNVLWFPNHEIAIDTVYRICVKISEGKYGVVDRGKSKRLNKPEDFLSLIPGVTKKKAKALLKRYDTIEGVCMASVDHLKTVDGVGPILAKNIHYYLCERTVKK